MEGDKKSCEYVEIFWLEMDGLGHFFAMIQQERVGDNN